MARQKPPAAAPSAPARRIVDLAGSVVAAAEAGALGCSISGSGPSVFSLCDSLPRAATVGEAMRAAFAAEGLEADLYVSPINPVGPRVLEDAGETRQRPRS